MKFLKKLKNKMNDVRASKWYASWGKKALQCALAFSITAGTVFAYSEAGGQGGSSGNGGGTAVSNADIEWYTKDSWDDCIAHPANSEDITGVVSFLEANGYNIGNDENTVRNALRDAYNECVNNYNSMGFNDNEPCRPRVVAIGMAYTKRSGQKWIMDSSNQSISIWENKWHAESDGKTYYSVNGVPYTNSQSFVNAPGKTTTSLALTNISSHTVFRIVVLDQSAPIDIYNAYISLTKKGKLSALTEGKSEYSVDGAQYALYRDRNKAIAGGEDGREEILTISGGKATSKTYSVSGNDNKFYLREIKAPNAGLYNLDSNVTEVILSKKDSNAVDVTDDEKHFKVEISKYIEGTQTHLAGAKMHLYYVKADGSRAEWPECPTWTTDGSPKVLSLIPGDYVLVEDEAPKGYYKSYPVTFTVKDQEETQYFSMEDAPIKLKIDKVDKKDTDTFVINAHLQVRDTTNTVVDGLDWYTDGSESIIDTSNLSNNSYYFVHEVEAAQGYFILEEDAWFYIEEYRPSDLDDEGFKHISAKDPPIEYYVAKKDADTGELVSGAKLQLKDSTGAILDEWTTDGTIRKIDNLLLSVGKTYSIHEVSAPKGYYVMGSDVSFTVNPAMVNREWYVECYDYPVKYSVAKVNEDGDYIPGAKLAVYEPGNDTPVDEWVTTTEAHVLHNLNDGVTYTVKELEAPAGYYRSEKGVEFTVEQPSATAQEKDYVVTFEDSSIEYTVTKTDKSGKKLLADATFTLKDSDGNPLTTIKTNSAEATAIPKECLKAGETYTLEETDAPAGYYYTNEAPVTFTVPSTVEEAKKVNKKDFAIAIKDPEIKYSIVKKDKETGEVVAGAQLALYSDEACEQKDLLFAWTTEDEPLMISNIVALVPGHTYYLRETDTTYGYYLNEEAEVFTVPLTQDINNKTITVTFDNQPIYWHVKKVDKDGNLLTTAKDGTSFTLEVYDTNETLEEEGDDTLIATLDTSDKTYKAAGYFDMQQYISEGLVLGGHTYRIHEKLAASGYRYTDDVFQTITLTDNADTTLVSDVTDEKFVVYLNKTDENGNLLTTFTNNENKQEGFILNIYNQTRDNLLVYTLDTSSEEYVKNGYMDISDYLNSDDTYVVKEEKVPTGYYRAKDYTFTLDMLETDENGVSHITIQDPTIKVQFRKESAEGTWVYEKNGQGFKFTVYDTKGTDDTSDDEAVTSINTLTDEHDEFGWISIGHLLKEGTTYRIHEISAPTGFKVSLQDAYVTTPDYYNDQLGSVINVKVNETSSGNESGNYGEDY